MNSSYCSSLEKLFSESIPEGWCLNILEALVCSYKETNKVCRSPYFGESEARDTRSHYLRGLFETKLRELSANYPGMAAESRPNKRRSYSHTWVKSGNLYLTASSVHTPKGKVRRADFRDIYQSNGQGELFETEKNLQSENPIYAILLYGSPQASFPSFLRIAFPSSHWDTYIESIDLIARYPSVISRIVPVEEMQEPSIEKLPEEIIQKPQTPGIRRLPKRAGEEKE
jgi:hypothetical protein